VFIAEIDGETLDLEQLHYSPDGKTWINSSLPPELHEYDLTWSAVFYPVEIAAIDTKVLLRLNVVDGDDRTKPIWYLGTPTTG